MNAQSTEEYTTDDVRAVKQIHERYGEFASELGGLIVGMEDVIEHLMIAILSRGHCILEGVPGLAKTLLVSSVAQMLGMSFRRIQFTPDLMPADITGSEVLEEDQATGKRCFRFIKGPLFANIILADEINRTPPKTQSALLEAMQEQQVTVGGQSYALPQPFFVLATQNPIEQEGTYPLPEAQLDRFMMKIRVSYPSHAEEIDIVKRATTGYQGESRQVWSGEHIAAMQAIVRKVPVPEHVYEFAVQLARRSRPGENGCPSFVGELISWGAGPRASICLLMGAKARAVLHGRHHVTTQDLVALAPAILRHRLIPTFNAEASGRTPDDLVRQLLESLSATRGKQGHQP